MLKLVPKIFRNLNAFSLIVILLISFITCILIASVFPVSKGQVQSKFLTTVNNDKWQLVRYSKDKKYFYSAQCSNKNKIVWTGDFTSYSKLARTTSPRNHAIVQKSRLFAQKRSHDSATSKQMKQKKSSVRLINKFTFLCVILGSIKVQRPSGGHKVPAYRVVHLGVATNAKLLLLDPTWSQYGEDTVLSSDSNGT